MEFNINAMSYKLWRQVLVHNHRKRKDGKYGKRKV